MKALTDFAIFMKGKDTEEVVKYVASKRFMNGDEAVEWELKAVDSDLDEAIRKECTKRVPIAGKRGRYNEDTDMDKYVAKLCVESIIYPNLNDAELQDFYKVKTPDALLKKMLKTIGLGDGTVIHKALAHDAALSVAAAVKGTAHILLQAGFFCRVHRQPALCGTLLFVHLHVKFLFQISRFCGRSSPYRGSPDNAYVFCSGCL